MEAIHGALNLLLLRGPEMNARKIPLSQLFFDEENELQEGTKVTWSQIGTVEGGWATTWMFCSFRKVTVTWTLWALLSFGIFLFCFAGAVDDVTF